MAHARGTQKIGQLTIAELDAFASRKLADGYAPATVNRMRETCGAVRRGTPGPAGPRRRPLRRCSRVRPSPVDRFTDHELALILKAASSEHYFAALLLLARTGLRVGEVCGMRWRDLHLKATPPRLTVVCQLGRWGQLTRPKTATPRRTIPLRPEVVTELERWRERQSLWAEHLGEDWHTTRGLVSTTRTGRPVSQRNISRAFHRARTAAAIDHGSLKTFRSTVATQLAERGLHPSKTQAFLGHAHVTTTRPTTPP